MSEKVTLDSPESQPGGPAACEAPAGSRSDKKQRHASAIPRMACNIRRGLAESAE
jgi:hypothetical protein